MLANYIYLLVFVLCFSFLPVASEAFISTTTSASFSRVHVEEAENHVSNALNSIPNGQQPQTVTTSSTDKGNNGESDSTKLKIASQLDGILKGRSSTLLENYNILRQNGTPEDVESYLNTILSVVDDVDTTTISASSEETEKKLPWWTKFRFTARLSKRSRIASLSRVLDLSTPTVEEKEDLGDDVDAKKRRRRRALVVLLRTLASSRDDDVEEGDKAPSKEKRKKISMNPIYKIEKAAKKDLKKSVSALDMESRLPPGLETPKYEVIVKRPLFEGGYEVRNYEAFSVCSVPMSKPRPDVDTTDQKVKNPQLSGASSFGALAGYLFGKNEEQKAMKMTTPVLTQGQGEEKEMSFVLPSDYWSSEGMAKAPTPLSNSLVQVKRDEGGHRATIMFGGFASSKDVSAKKEQLLRGLESDKEWVNTEDNVALAQYNDPFTPPWKRRNEVSVAVKRRDI